MKGLNWIFNGVLAALVVVLFVLHFVQEKHIPGQGSQSEESVAVPAGDFKIAYVYVDSLLTHYDLYQDLADQMIKKKASLESELATKGSTLEKEIADFQYKVQKHLITSWDAADQEKKLGEKQQVLINLQNDMQNRLLEEEASFNRQIHDSVISTVNRYNADKGYHMILSHTFGGGLLYAEDYMNVTADILAMLNASYAESKK